jgi:hypothetical protein
LREEHRLMVFESRVLRRICGPNITMDLREIKIDGANWIRLA